MFQAKYEAATRHGIKAVSPDWLIDTIETGALADEEEYQPRERERGDHTHQLTQECNGDVMGGVEYTNEGLRHSPDDQNRTTDDQNRTTDDQTVPEAKGEPREGKEEEEMEVESGGCEVAAGEDSSMVVESPDVGSEGVRGEGVGSEEGLLSGLVFHLTGYLECMDPDTLSKWKEVYGLLQ